VIDLRAVETFPTSKWRNPGFPFQTIAVLVTKREKTTVTGVLLVGSLRNIGLPRMAKRPRTTEVDHVLVRLPRYCGKCNAFITSRGR